MFIGFYTFLASNLALAEVQPATNVTLGLSNWRAGLNLNTRHGIYIPMFEKEDSVLFQGTGLKLQGDSSITPAYLRAGGRVTFSPLAILDLTGYGQYDAYFGNLQTIVDYDSASDNYGSNADIATYIEETGRQSSGSGWHSGGAVTLKVKVGPMIVLSNTDLSYWNINSETAHVDWFFDREIDVMMKFEGDTLLEENALVMYEKALGNDKNVRIGSITTYRHSFTADDTMFRSGLIAMYNLPSGLSHTVIVQPYLEDRAFTTSFPPYAAYALRYNK